MPERSGRELLNDWPRLIESMFGSAASLAGRSQVPRQLRDAMEGQLGLVEEVLERERGLRKGLAGLVLAPVDAVLDVLEQSAATLRRQAETMEAAGRALEETGALMKDQADLFAQTIGTLRKPAELAKAAAGLDPTERKGGGVTPR